MSAPEHTGNYIVIPFEESSLGHIVTMDEFYQAVQLIDMFRSGAVNNVQQIWMNEEQCSEVNKLCKRNAKKDKRFKHLSDHYIETSVGMDWLCYSPVSVPYVPRNQLWIWDHDSFEKAMEEFRHWLQHDGNMEAHSHENY